MPDFDFKKQYKELYLPPAKPVLIDVPKMNFLMVDGIGDPNGNEAIQNAVGALYSISWAIKMLPKKGIIPEGYFAYSVAPLEGLWGLTDGGVFSFTERGNWAWTVMIRQPDFVSVDLVADLLPGLMKKKPNPALELLRFESFTEGLCVQMMHTGPFATEPDTMEHMMAFIAAECLADRIGTGGRHHEIYLTDMNKTKPENNKTVLRHPVARQQGGRL